jgi:hypothetical protein
VKQTHGVSVARGRHVAAGDGSPIQTTRVELPEIAQNYIVVAGTTKEEKLSSTHTKISA